MRKVVLNLAVSLDGDIAGPNRGYDWCLTDSDYSMKDFLKSVDATPMGGKSYRLVVNYRAPYPEFANYIFTRTAKDSPYENVVFVSGDIPGFLVSLKCTKGKNIWLFGGSEIIHPLIQENLVDEMMLAIHRCCLEEDCLYSKILMSERISVYLIPLHTQLAWYSLFSRNSRS